MSRSDSVLLKLTFYQLWWYNVQTFPPSTTGLSYFIPPTSPTGHTDTRWVLLIWNEKRNQFVSASWGAQFAVACRHSLASLQRTNTFILTSSNICRLYVLSSSAKYTTPCWPSAPGWALRSSRSHRRPSFLCSTPRGFSQLGSPWGERRNWCWI